MNKPDEALVDPTDLQVRRAYRALPGVSTPVELDHAVLQQVAAAARQPLAKSYAWTRPLAFAATAILGVTLLFETADGPMPATESGIRSEQIGKERALPEATSRQNSVPGNAAMHDELAATPDAANIEKPARRAAKFAADSRAERPATDVSEPLRERQSTTTPATVTLEMRANDSLEKHEAETASPPTATAVAASGRTSQAAAAPTADRHCDKTQRTTAETWWLCIQALRDADKPADADAELAELIKRHPDFRGHLK